MESRDALAARCESRASLHLSFSAGQRHHLGRLRLRRQRLVKQEMPRPAYRLLSRAQARLARGAHARPWRRIAGGKKALRRGGLPERLRQDEFRHAYSARAFPGLESHDYRRRHRLDANRRRRPALRRQSGERLLWRGAWDELQIESERDEVDRTRHALYERGVNRRWRCLVGREGRRAAGARD